MKSVSDAPELRIERLKKLIKKFTAAPSMVLSALFGSDKWDTDNIDWKSETGNRGLTPFSGENVEAPRVAPTGTADHSAKAAFWKEKMYLSSQFLNNISDIMNPRVHQRAVKYLAKQTMMLAHRCSRRKEWLFSKMLSAGSFSYKDPDNNSLSVDYGIPAANQVTLGATSKWNYTGDSSTINILSYIMDAQTVASNSISAPYTIALFTSEVMKLMVMDTGIQNLLQKSAFGSGDLFAKPKAVLGALLNIPNMVLYDEAYQVKSWITSAVAAGAGPHTINGDDFTDFEVGMTVHMADVSAGTASEIVTITAVDVGAGTITADGTLAISYQAGMDFCYVTKKFLETNKFVMFSPTVEGVDISEFALSPFALNRNWGMMADRNDEWDPDGIFIRVQNKGIPVLYHPDAIYQLTVT